MPILLKIQNYQSKPLSEGWLNGLNPKIKTGNYKIPKFQREFVWSLEQSAKLIDSVIKGYPIGTFKLWKTKERFISVKYLGGHELPEPPENTEIYYVLDGQQRITSLYTAFNGLKINKGDIGKEELDFKRLYVDLNTNIESEDFVQILSKDEVLSNTQIPIYVIALGGDPYIKKLLEIGTLSYEMAHKLSKINQQIQTAYSYSIIDVENTPIEIATEIFTRINTGGKQLTSFEIMCAKTYIEGSETQKGFDLAEQFEELIDKLKEKEFDSISPTSVLQVMSSIINGKVDTKSILSIDRFTFRDNWDSCKSALFKSIDFMKANLGVSASRILPYDSIIVPFSYYFKHSDIAPTGNAKSYLETIFWHTSLSESYSGSSVAEIEKDISRVKVIQKGEKPDFKYHTKAKLIDNDKILKNGDFVSTKSFCKAILCAINLKNPKSIYNGNKLLLENDYLIRSNSKQFHHFFPKAYLKKQNNLTHKVLENNIANIIFLDAESNQKIGKTAPERYLEICKDNNSHSNESFQSILNSNILPNYTEEYGRYLDFDMFIEWRIKALVEHIRSVIKILD